MQISSAVPLVEPFAVADIYFKDVARIEEVGNGNLRLYLTVPATNLHTGMPENHVVCRLIIQRDQLGVNSDVCKYAVTGVQGIVRETVIDLH